MAWRLTHLEVALAKSNLVPLSEITVRSFRTAILGESDLAAQLPLQQPGTGHMVCVDMGLEREQQVQSKLPYQRDIPTRLLEDWIDDHRLSASAVAEEVGVGGGLWVEQLPEDQHRFSPRRLDARLSYT